MTTFVKGACALHEQPKDPHANDQASDRHRPETHAGRGPLRRNFAGENPGHRFIEHRSGSRFRRPDRTGLTPGRAIWPQDRDPVGSRANADRGLHHRVCLETPQRRGQARPVRWTAGESRLRNAMETALVTGLGCITALRGNVPRFWDALTDGQSGVGRIRGFPTDYLRNESAAEIPLSPQTLAYARQEGIDSRLELFAAWAVEEAVRQAG